MSRSRRIYQTVTFAESAVVASKTAFGGDFSTSEVDTGFKWIDGKTIYKMTKTGTLPSVTNGNEQTVQMQTLGFGFISTLIDAHVILRPTSADTPDGTQISPNGYSASRGSMSFMQWGAAPNTSVFLYLMGNGSTRHIKVTLWYTKY